MDASVRFVHSKKLVGKYIIVIVDVFLYTGRPSNF